MKIKYLSVLFCALAAVSCAPGAQSDPFAFPATQKLTLDSISVGEILQPFEWMPVGDKAVLSSPRSDSLFWVYRLPGFEFLYAFGSKGEGPYEFAYFGQLIPDVQMQQRFFVGDRSKILSYRLDDETVSDVQRIALENAAVPKMRVNDSIVVSMRMNFSQEGVDYIYNTVNIRTGAGVDTVRALLGAASLQVSEKGAFLESPLRNVPVAAFCSGGFALAYPDVRSLHIYRVDGRGKIAERKVAGRRLSGDQVKALTDADFQTGYGLSAAQGTDRYIYLLAYDYDPHGDSRIRTPLACYVQVYDWDGRPVKRFDLDRVFNNMLVDPAGERFYFFNSRNDFEWVYASGFKL